MRVIPIIERLKAEVSLVNERVEQSRSLLALSDDEIEHDVPLVFVHTFVEKAHENETIGSVDQRLPKKFAVMYAAKNVDLDARTEPLEDLRDQVFRALLGWSPDSEHSSIEFVEGAILATSDMLVQWTDVFVTETILCDQ